MKLIKNKGKKKKTEGLEEHHFMAACLGLGIKMDDMKELEYVDIAKIMICTIPEDTKYRKATAEDWDKLM